MVYVLDKHGNPLMPTTRHRHVRHLLRDGLAVVVDYNIFTIQLTYDTTSHTQPFTLGVDCGAKHVGLSATNERIEGFAGQGEVRNDVKKLMDERRMLRRSRRNRLRRRPARFNNRCASTRKGRYSPSTVSRVAFHIKLIKKVKSILPIKNIVLEVGEFDTQKMENPDIQGKEYQNGDAKGFENTKKYVYWRDGYTCQHCGKTGTALHAHHIVYRSKGGSNMADNLITLCEDCHKKVHSGKIQLNVEKPKLLKEAGHMNTMRKLVESECRRLFGDNNVSVTYGYETSYNRNKYGLGKSHDTDGFIIAGNYGASRCDKVYLLKQLRRHNRQLHRSNIAKGGKLLKAQQRHVLRGYRQHDIVRYDGELYDIVGRREKGSFVLMRLSDGSRTERVPSRLSYVRRHGAVLVYNLFKVGKECDSPANLKN
jgi:5-methylcytosine-specific restriction endonuclease McrA